MRASAATSARRRPISTRRRARCDLVGAAGAERACDQGLPIDIAGPRLGERARQREQHRPARQRPPRGAGAQPATAGVDDQGARGEKRCDLVEAQRLLAAGEEAPSGGTIERSPRLRHLGQRAPARVRDRPPRARGRAPPAPDRCAASAAPARPRSIRPPPPATAAGHAHRGVPARPRPRRGGRAARAGAPRSGAPAARWRDRRAPRAWPPRPPASAASRRGRAWPAPTSASATTQRARASSSWAPKPRAARRRSSRARGYSPSWAMAMPRRASAGGSSRSADPLEGAERVAGGEGARGSGDQGVHDDRLLRRADFAPRLKRALATGRQPSRCSRTKKSRTSNVGRSTAGRRIAELLGAGVSNTPTKPAMSWIAIQPRMPEQ